MNKSPDAAATDSYIAQLPLDADQREALAQEVVQQDDELLAVHRALAGSESDASDSEAANAALLASVSARLELGWGDTLERARALGRDHQGRICITSTPPIVRTRMVPEPWHTNVLRLSWWRFLRKKNRNAEVPPAELVDRSGWRRVAAFRRTTLLVLMLVQTVIATWHMKSVLPYQGWALVNQELEEGLVSLAAPIRDRSGRTIAALNISGQFNRTPPEHMQARFLPKLRDAADRISQLLGTKAARL